MLRGTFGRNKATNEVKMRQHQRGVAFLQYLCVQLQRCFRGYYSRKYKHDQHRRKLYCQMIAEKGQAAAEQMRQYSQEQAERLEEEARLKRKEEFELLARNLHHLTSTRHIRGIYNPLLNLLAAPTMNQLPVEEHIRGVVKDLLRTRGYTKKGLMADTNGTLKIPLKGLKQRLSVQASSHFDALKEASQQQQLYHKYASMSARNFLGGGRTRIIDNNDPPLAADEPFLDQWANPLLVKGVPKDQKQLLESSRLQKPLFAGPPEKPFVSRVGGNRSTTMPNDLFDIIADANETGGAIQRHLGTGTARFGVSASCDARSALPPPSLNMTATAMDMTAAPHPPMRTGVTLRSTKAKSRTEAFSLKLRPKPKAVPGVTARFAAAMAAAASAEDSASSDDEPLLSLPVRAATAV